MMEWQKLLAAGRKPDEILSEYDPVRSPFEMDFDRIIFSHPFRMLQDKTQVHPLPIHDFVHTRLSHSLEVSSVGRSLGKSVGKVVLERHTNLRNRFTIHDFGGIVAAASLAHDIGNPPFGHSGENAISDFFIHHPSAKRFHPHLTSKELTDLTNFEGNAQGFRILNNDHFVGAPLTKATLAAFSKYPRESTIAKQEKGRRSQKKYGFFQAEADKFKALAQAVGLIPLNSDANDLAWSRHPLTFLVEAADDICYGIIDLEDGCRLGLISLEETVDLLAPILSDRFDPAKLSRHKRLEDKLGALRAMSISTLIDECVHTFVDNEEGILKAEFDKALTDSINSSKALSTISSVSFEKIYRSRKVLETEAVGFEILPGILRILVEASYFSSIDRDSFTGKHKAIARLLPADLQEMIFSGTAKPYEILMTCTDFITNMTDTGALSFYRLIKGIDLPKG